MLLPRATGETVSSDLDWFFRRDGSMFPVSYVSVAARDAGGPRRRRGLHRHRGPPARRARRCASTTRSLAAQQASLRRVAALVAGGAASADVFAAIAREVGHVIGLPLVAVWRYEPDGTATVVGAWSDRPHPFQVGTRWPLDGPTICRTDPGDRPARADRRLRGDPRHDRRRRPRDRDPRVRRRPDHRRRRGLGRDVGRLDRARRRCPTTSRSGSPSSRSWSPRRSRTPRAQDELARLADEQAALRRVATLVAQGVPAGELFAAVTEEVGQLLGADAAATIRYEPGDMLTAVGNWTAEGVDADTEVGRQWPLAGESIAPRILEDRAVRAHRRLARRARADRRLRPREQLGLELLGRKPDPRRGPRLGQPGRPLDQPGRSRATPRRASTSFTELVATAIAERAGPGRGAAARGRAGGAAARGDAGRARAAAGGGLRRGRRGGGPAPARREHVDAALRGRRDRDRRRELGARSATSSDVGTRMPVGGATSPRSSIARGGPPGSTTTRAATGALGGARCATLGISAAVGCPIVVDGRLWGVDDRRAAVGRAAAGRHRGAGRAVHRARSPPRSRTSRRGRTSPRRGRGSWRPPTTSAGASCATCTTERSSGWSTR